MAEFNGIVTGEGRRFVVLASRFNHHITEKLAELFSETQGAAPATGHHRPRRLHS